jgi:hypothetical protein
MPRSTNKTPLSHLRFCHDYDQINFCELLGWTEDVLKSIETGRVKMTVDRAVQVALATGISPEWLLQEDPTLPMTAISGREYTIDAYEKAPCKWQAQAPDHPVNLLCDEAAAGFLISALKPLLKELLEEASRTSRLDLVMSQLHASIENIRGILPSEPFSDHA